TLVPDGGIQVIAYLDRGGLGNVGKALKCCFNRVSGPRLFQHNSFLIGLLKREVKFLLSRVEANLKIGIAIEIGILQFSNDLFLNTVSCITIKNRLLCNTLGASLSGSMRLENDTGARRV